ncbi:MAG: MBL fold metallo-hydrolase, partial [Deltaproteobacteria bacterium]|nr:MBL fold metallo-hydrolase [Deltaproteobacteria bacterium]
CVESEGRKIVIDPWISFDPRRAQPDAPEQAEKQLAALADAGFAPGDVDVVVSTHLDGIGWSTRPDGDGGWIPSFPNARYVWTSLEIDRVLDDDAGDAASLAPLLDAGCVDTVAAPHALTSEVRLEPAPGHTPGNVNVWIESGGDAAVVVGDLLLHPLQLADPDWGGLDMDAAGASAARRKLLAAAEKSGALVIGPHFPTPGAFRVESAGGAWRPIDPPTSAPIP